MFFLRGRKRKKLLATQLTDEQRDVMHSMAPLTAKLAEAALEPPPGGIPANYNAPVEAGVGLRIRHEGIVNLLLSEKHFEGADGLEVTDEMKLCIAGQAALLQLRADADYYPGLDTILVYPEAFVVEHERYDECGLVSEEEADLSGESWQRGVVVLAWSDVRREATARDGYNVVLHEFAHQLDDQSGTADGTPVLSDTTLAADWADAFQHALERTRADMERDEHVLFDEDSIESPAEFFATAVELFFEYSGDLRKVYPEVYGVLGRYLEVDPGRW